MQTKARGKPQPFAAPDDRIQKPAPEFWRGSRAQGETLEAFFRRVWGPYLACGLHALQLRRRDPALWKALHQHIVRYALPWPADLALPGLKPRHPDAIAKLDAGHWRELSDDEIIAALMQRQRDQVKEGLHALRERKRELRLRRAAIKKDLQTAARRKRG